MRTLVSMVAVVCLLSVPAGAIVVAPMSFQHVVEQSLAVVYARVTAVDGRWTSDRRRIESVVMADALQYFKGDLGEQVRFVVPGGAAGGMTNVVPGAPAFAVGDLVVLCLDADGPAIPRPVGLTQGVFRVTPDHRSGTLLVTPTPVTIAGPIVRGATSRRPQPLARFGAEVRSVMEAAR